MPMINEAVYCVMEGVGTPEAVDTVMKLGMNHPMGPLALADLIGLDTCVAILDVLHKGLGDPKYRACPLLRKYVAAGWLGPEDGTRLLRSTSDRAGSPAVCRHALDAAHTAHPRPGRDPDGWPGNSPRNEIAPCAAEWDRESHFEPALIGQMGDLGFLGMLVPEEHDGLGLDNLTYLIALEEIAAADASVAVLMSVHNSLPTQMILRYGNAEQKQRFLAPMARGELLGAFALSEPDAGSDAASLRAQAVRDGDYWVLNGTKAWVTSGNHAGVILAMVRTDTPEIRRGARGISTFILTPDLPGFSVGKKEDKMGLRASPTVQLVFDDMRVPARPAARRGRAGVRLRHAVARARPPRDRGAGGRHRATRARAGRGLRQRAQAVRHAIKEFQAIQFKLADMATRVTPRARSASRRRRREGSRRGGRRAHVHGEARRQRSRDVGHHAGDPDLRRLRLHEGLSASSGCSATRRSPRSTKAHPRSSASSSRDEP